MALFERMGLFDLGWFDLDFEIFKSLISNILNPKSKKPSGQ
jgi:hypothetical protein